jgi:hypothetical protein
MRDSSKVAPSANFRKTICAGVLKGRGFEAALAHSRRMTAQLKLLPFKQNVAVFLWFPQRNSVLHSLFTTRHQFSVAALSLFKQSIASANVRCLERYGLQ